MNLPKVHSVSNSFVPRKRQRASARKFGLSRLGTVVHNKSDKYKTTVAKNIMILRDLTKLTQGQLAELAGVSTATVCKLELANSANGLNVSTIEKIGKVWALQPWELMSEQFNYSDFKK